MKKVFLLCSCVIYILQTGFSQNLDPAFGNHGIAKNDLGSHFNYNNAGKQVLVQPDGSTYLVFGNTESYPDINDAPYPTTIQKLLPDGSIDVSYGVNGLSLEIPIYSPHGAIQSDGKIIVAGYTLAPGQLCSCGASGANRDNFAVARFNTDGTLDNTFNDGNIKVVDVRNDNYVRALAIQNDGKIIIAGDAVAEFDGNFLALLRINNDGSIDGTFNETETIIDYLTNSVAIQSDGKIVVAGTEGGMPSVRRFNSDGSVDNTFSGTGVESVDFGTNGYSTSMVIQSDDKIILGGYVFNGTDGDFELVRVNAEGGVDNTFDLDGVQTIDFSGSDDILTSLAIQTDGKIVAGGYTGGTTNIDFAIARLNTDGSLDNAFGTNGKQTTDFGLFSSKDYINSIAIQNDGKLIALGYAFNGTNTYIASARYNTNGTSDMSFNGCGSLVPLIQQGNTYYSCTAVQSDSKILAAGYTWDGTKYNFAIARYNTNGSLDNTFSANGVQTTIFGSADSKAYAIAMQSDGKILVAGSAGGYCALARYNPDGSLDNTFDGDGKVIADFAPFDERLGTPYEESVALAIQADGKILVGGVALARYNSNGSLDLTFSGDGEVTSFQDGSAINCGSIAVQNDGKIVVSGYDQLNNPALMVARYNTDGSPDNTFNGNGEDIIFATSLGDGTIVRGKSTLIQSDGKILVAGYDGAFYHENYSEFMLIRLNTNGALDPTFNSGNIVLTLVGSSNFAYGFSAVIQLDNKIIVAGYSYNGSSPDFTILRYNSDGSLDNNFNGNGIVVTQASSAYDRIFGIALDDDKLYAAGFGQYPGNFGVLAKYIIASGGSLPVTLTDFTATLKDKSVLLQWQTASEHNLSGFIIERSAHGADFSSIGSVAATGNSSIKVNYSALDNNPLNGTNFYRLKITDADGKFSYSKVVEVTINRPVTLSVFPNPASDLLFVQTGGENEKATFEIMDVTGKKLKQGQVTLQANTSFSINVNALPKGTYILQLNTKSKIETRRFVKR